MTTILIAFIFKQGATEGEAIVVPGIEYALDVNRLHYRVDENRAHYRLKDEDK